MKMKKLIIIEKAWTELTTRLEYIKDVELQQILYHEFLTIAYDLSYCLEFIINIDYIHELISFEDVEEVYEYIKYDNLT